MTRVPTNDVCRRIDSPLGPLGITVDERGRLVSIYFPNPGERVRDDGPVAVAPTERVVTQLGEYFDGRRRDFDLELAPRGTDFQRAVWKALLDIPWGATSTYGELAAAIGRPSASRAVGAANGANPIPIVIPCHRVIGRDGTLTGYGGGLDKKAILLTLEGVAFAA